TERPAAEAGRNVDALESHRALAGARATERVARGRVDAQKRRIARALRAAGETRATCVSRAPGAGRRGTGRQDVQGERTGVAPGATAYDGVRGPRRDRQVDARADAARIVVTGEIASAAFTLANVEDRVERGTAGGDRRKP